jgi:eukaryotic-like serine/threonine-protein kinase
VSSLGDLTGALVADKYELLRLIGRGGMGAVYEARNVATLKRCAVKLLLTPELAGDAEVVKRFFREAKASGMIESDHVVAAFDSGIDGNDHVYYVMECLQGEDLEQTLTRLGELNPTAAAKIILQAATGLSSAHALGIVHRDVKPANLFLALAPGGEVKVKILDFGVAKVKMEVFNESTSSLTVSGSLLGTPLYMSPEQLRRASAIDESSDIWSLGVVLFECLTGELPWGDCDGIGELVTAILTARLPLVQDLAPWVGPELAEIAQRALSRDPIERLKSASELREGLLKVVGGDPRLYLHEITGPDDQQRRSLAPRLSLPAAVTTGTTPHSGTPVAATVSPAPLARRSRSLPLSFAGLALATGAVWLLTTRQQPAALAPSAATPPIVASPAPPSPTLASMGPTAEPQPQPFSIEVGPPGAEISVDRAPARVDGGKVRLQGAVGSIHELRLTYGGKTTEQQVVLTLQGPVPARVWAPIVGQPKPARSGAEPVAKATATVATPALAPATPAAAPSGLSTVFE